jgi:transposase
LPPTEPSGKTRLLRLFSFGTLPVVGRVEAAAERAIDIGARTYGSVKCILDNNLDRRPAQKRDADGTPTLHPNIRGPRHYN